MKLSGQQAWPATQSDGRAGKHRGRARNSLRRCPCDIFAKPPRATQPRVLIGRAHQDVVDAPARQELDALQQRRALAGDIDTVVLKALRKLPSQRYTSVEPFLSEARQHFDNVVAANDGDIIGVPARA